MECIMTNAYRFEFDRNVPLSDAEESLFLAASAVEGIFGRARVQLDFAYHIDEPRSVITVDAASDVGTTVTRVFTGFLLREHGEGAFRVRVVRRESDPTADSPRATKEAAA